MLIINADDFGINRCATNRILSCYENKRITSTSAMVFMVDSERSAELALSSGIDVGLHLNFTEGFSRNTASPLLDEYMHQVSRFLMQNKYNFLFYNPMLVAAFEYLYRVQCDEFQMLYGKPPSHIDGHLHMHLCTNIMISKLIPKDSKVRTGLYFSKGEKNNLNRLYRYFVDVVLKLRYVCVDYLFGIEPVNRPDRLARIVNLSKSYDVELMVHPQRTEEYEYLMNSKYADLISGASIGTYGAL